MPDPGPLAGVRVLDASRVLAGPFCGQLLGDLGADVVKLERPGGGDETRGWGPPFDGPFSAYFLSCNRNKRGLALDLATPEGARLFHDLLARCDVLLENFRTDSARRLGLGHDELLARHPRLVVASVSGFGRTGPLADVPGYDFAVQALSGLMSGTGPADGPPCKVGVAVADVVTGLYAATAVLAALRDRDRTGRGRAADLALFDCAVAAQVNLAQAYLTTGTPPPRQGNAHLQIVPYRLFETADGWLVLAVGNDDQWRRFCAAAGADDLAADGRYAANAGRVRHRDELEPRVAAVMRGRTSAAWEDVLTAAGVSHAPVRDLAGAFGSPSAAARGLRAGAAGPDGRAVPLVGSPVRYAGEEPPPRCPPLVGQHTDEVLRDWLGLSADEVAALRRGGVVG